MNYFLAKTDPETYSIDNLEKEKITTWDGVHSYQALINMREMQKGDLVFIYHSMTKKTLGPGIVGIGEIITNPKDNPNDVRKSVIVDIKFLKRFNRIITLNEIKSTGLFNDWALIKQSRLSTMHVPPEFVKWIKTIIEIE